MRALGLAALALCSSAVAGEVHLEGEEHVTNPVWSAVGTWIAFEVNDYANGIQLYVAEVDGAGGVGRPQPVQLPGSVESFSAGSRVVANPVWHPQGLLVFEGSNARGVYRLYDAQPGGAASAELSDAASAPGELSSPALSSDGRLVAFVWDQTGHGDLYT